LQYEFPKKLQDNKANYIESGEEEVLLIAQLISNKESSTPDLWFIDSGCSNHMTGRKDWFSSIDTSFGVKVKLGNNHSLKFQEKNQTIEVKQNKCKVFHENGIIF